jgi:single-strand DNA-binding protein
MEIIGRLTANAKVSETKAGKKVVNFSIAINDTYKTKDSSEVKRITTFVNCAYWINAGIAAYLTKGSLVECAGRIGVNAWTGKDGEAKAALTFHVNSIKLYGKSNGGNTITATSGITSLVAAAADDLPF